MAAQRIKGGRLRLLEFFDGREETTAWNLVEQFDYTYEAARTVLKRLGYRKLITRIDTGVWTITDKGQNRVDYLKRKSAK